MAGPMSVRGGWIRTMPRLAALLAIALLAPLALDSQSASATGYATVISHGSTTRPAVALTFDDGWTGSGALRIARILVAKDARATFFPYGAAVLQSPAIFDWIARQPNFEIANHTATHDILCRVTSGGCVSTGVSPFREIKGGRTIVAGITGRAMLPVLRPPGGNYNASVRAASLASGFPRMVLWNVTAADTVARTSGTVRTRIAKAGNGAIILAHMGPTTTMAALPGAIDDLRAKGLSLVTLSELLRLTPEPGQPAQDYVTGGFGPPGVGPRWQPSEALDAAGHRHLAWTSPDGVWYATDASGTWVGEQVAASIAGSEYFEQPSLRLVGGAVTIALTDETETASVVMIATRAVDGWTMATVPGQHGFASMPSLAISGSDLYLAYREQGPWSPATRTWPKQGLYLATRKSGTWTTERFSREAGDQNPSVAVDPVTHRPVVAFRARSASGVLPLGTYLAIRSTTSWSYTRITAREAYPSLRISASRRRHVLLADALSTRLLAGSAVPGHAFSFRTVGFGVQASLVKPGRAVATTISSSRHSALREFGY